ncbi:hypothetical protein AMELA_G00042640 [Ameiurus melas]|uniref:Uncharacterized protein n=1 Tax=Ameiurus melas TaxID=219545 RepID=A0A7J6B5Y1_AMEME|nr:hypothetical protein AMELA_G00042640 [Ameiurus melas]
MTPDAALLSFCSSVGVDDELKTGSADSSPGVGVELFGEYHFLHQGIRWQGNLLQMMKSHEGELEREISKLQVMVLELRSGFSRALLELNQIQLGDTELQNQLEETRHGCNKRTLHLETLVLTLKEELEEIRCQIHQLCDEQVKSEQTNSHTGAQSASAPGCSGVKDISSSTNGMKNVNEVMVAPPLCTVGGALLLHCYLQGLWAGHNSGEVSSQVSLRSEGVSSCMQAGRRHRVSISLLKSEWDYFTKLNLLQEKYRTPSSSHTETQ